ncbi:hypothetical protein H2199_004980 [Coniosporium tulheliwenetii]|uniref:Uncharacterized protein n=1 Tax=Coniosporium tulheliwenetii TaxID=3383036 RepID=A0ACC2Z2M6_9PEZI|nr:hypothetical protein H2199_004980 [Cladosporium sp. JES 115]
MDENAVRVRSIYASKLLNPSKQEIRLLSVTRNPEDQLIGELRVVSLHDAPIYSALSYVWGDPEKTLPLQLDGVAMKVTINLEHALRQLVSEDEALASKNKALASERKAYNIWIDAVSINQKDSTEREHQIRLMEKIYSSAEKTFIWLGKAAKYSNLAIDLVSKISDADFQNYNAEAPAWKALYEIFQRQWWSRVWVVQEAILSRCPIVKCGAKEVELERFVDLAYLYVKYRNLDTERFLSLRYLTWVPYYDMLWKDIKGWLGTPLWSWFHGARKFHSTETRDRVYALLGLIEETSRREIGVDCSRKPGTNEYTKSDGLVLLEATVVMYDETGLDVLHYAEDETSAGLDLPSWCPDWMRNPGLSPMFTWGYSAFPTSTPDRSPWSFEGIKLQSHHVFRISKGLRTLAVKGLIVDVVDFADRAPPVSAYRGYDIAKMQQHRSEKADQTRRAIKRWETHVLLRKANAYATTCGSAEAFWRTVIADRSHVRGETSVAATFGSGFNVWMGRPDPNTEAMIESEKLELARVYRFAAMARCTGRSFITTRNGYFGLAAQTTQVGDCVCIIRGAESAFILRSKFRRGSIYKVIGAAYIHGIMNGEYLETADPDEVEELWLQ